MCGLVTDARRGPVPDAALLLRDRFVATGVPLALASPEGAAVAVGTPVAAPSATALALLALLLAPALVLSGEKNDAT